MNCDQCGGESRVVETRNGPPFTVKRRRECLNCGNRFNTFEVHARILPPATDALRRSAVAIKNRVARWNQDIDVATRLGDRLKPSVDRAPKLAEQMGIHIQSLRRIARRGRDHLKKIGEYRKSI